MQERRKGTTLRTFLISLSTSLSMLITIAYLFIAQVNEIKAREDKLEKDVVMANLKMASVETKLEFMIDTLREIKEDVKKITKG